MGILNCCVRQPIRIRCVSGTDRQSPDRERERENTVDSGFLDERADGDSGILDEMAIVEKNIICRFVELDVFL